MKKKAIPIAKITRPRLSGIFPRDRLFRLLDEGRQKPIVWVAAPAGSGKTTFVASWLDARKIPCLWYQIDEGDGDIASFFYYMSMAVKKAAPRQKKPLPLLTPEYLQGVPVFTRRYFEELFRRLKPPTVVVFDNYQDAPPASGFRDMLVHGLDTVPEGITVVILSRVAPPPQLARLHANNRLQLIGWAEVRFTREESEGLLETHVHGKPSLEALELLHSKTEGWAAGLILLTAGAGGTTPALQAPEGMTTGGLFDYFASEIFSKTDSAIQDVLLKTSFLQKIDPAVAEKLTENATAGQILERLSHDHYFTQKYGRTYEYHPLFREFLRTRAKSELSTVAVVAVQRNAAELLEQSGHGEEATGLYIEACDWTGAERVVLSQAPILVSQGRSQTLEGWLNRFSQERIDGSPWLLYWRGICRMAFDPRESRGWIEKSFEKFRTNCDMTGAFLSWASIVDTYNYEWGDFSPLDHWIAVLEELLLEHPQFPSSEIEVRVAAAMLNAMTYRQPKRDDLPQWAERVLRIVLASDNVQLRMMLGNQLIFYYLWVGDFSKAPVVIDALRPVGGRKDNDPLTQQNWYVMEAMYSWFMADGKTCLQAVTSGLNNAQNSGVHLLDLYLLAQGVYSGVSLGDPSAAVSCLEKMSLINSPRLMDKALYQYQASSVAWYNGDRKKAIEHGRQAVKITEDIGCPISLVLCLIEQAVTLFDDGQYDEADGYLARALDIGRGMIGLEFLCSLHNARFAFRCGREKHGLAVLKRGLELGARHGFLNIPRWNKRAMSRLCAKAIEHGLETEYVQKLIRVHNLMPENDSARMDNWPWPFKIYTLGRFELFKDGQLIRFTGKIQQKPLALLKTLIAFGGRDVAEERFIDTLWPDADGDLAHRSFEMTVHRLRKLIDHEGTIQLQERRLTLDMNVCRVDAWAFEKALEGADHEIRSEEGMHHERSESDLELLEKALSLYKGPFLASDSAHPWVLSYRERLRSKFLRAVIKLGTHWEQATQWERAAEIVERGLEVDGHAEEFYQHLMLCHQQLGRQAEAISVYNRCRAFLGATLGISPSPRTEELYQAIKNGR